jgi:predicted acetylornithine/succinylornithine family transaminase
MSGIATDEARFLMGTFKRVPVELVRGEGFLVFDAEGNEYLDFVAGIAVNVLGHAHPAVVAAITAQASALIHTSNLYYTRPQVELSRRLTELGFPGRVFLSNSGAEANEAAIKIARKWGKLNRGGAYEVITALDSFHGRTLATLAATGQPKYQEPFLPMPDGFRHVPFNDIVALGDAISERTAAVLLEPVQGESGIIPANADYLKAARALCDERGLLLMFDEIQTGMGRTGTFYAFQGYGVVPDVLTLAKGLGGGVPIGACIAGPRADVLTAGDHGSTFGGNPLAASAALAVLDTLTAEGLVENAKTTGAYLNQRLAGLAGDFDCVAGARGIGLMQALVLNQDLAPKIQAEALAHGLIVNAIGPRIIRLVPPLTVGKAEVDRAVGILAQSIDLALAGAPA